MLCVRNVVPDASRILRPEVVQDTFARWQWHCRQIAKPRKFAGDIVRSDNGQSRPSVANGGGTTRRALISGNLRRSIRLNGGGGPASWWWWPTPWSCWIPFSSCSQGKGNLRPFRSHVVTSMSALFTTFQSASERQPDSRSGYRNAPASAGQLGKLGANRR